MHNRLFNLPQACHLHLPLEIPLQRLHLLLCLVSRYLPTKKRHLLLLLYRSPQQDRPLSRMLLLQRLPTLLRSQNWMW